MHCWHWQGHVKDQCHRLTVIWKSPPPSPLPWWIRGMKRPSSDLNANVDMTLCEWFTRVYKIATPGFPPNIYILKVLAYRRLPKLATTSHCAVESKHAKAPGCSVVGMLHQRTPSPLYSKFTAVLSLCLSFLHSLVDPREGSRPQTLLDAVIWFRLV